MPGLPDHLMPWVRSRSVRTLPEADKAARDALWRQARQHVGDAYGVTPGSPPAPAAARKEPELAAISLWSVLGYALGCVAFGFFAYFLLAHRLLYVAVFLGVVAIMLVGKWFFRNPLALLLILLFGDC